MEEETSEEDIVRTFMRVVFECSKLLCDHCARNGGARTNSKDVFEFLNKVRQNPSMLIPLIEVSVALEGKSLKCLRYQYLNC